MFNVIPRALSDFYSRKGIGLKSGITPARACKIKEMLYNEILDKIRSAVKLCGRVLSFLYDTPALREEKDFFSQIGTLFSLQVFVVPETTLDVC